MQSKIFPLSCTTNEFINSNDLTNEKKDYGIRRISIFDIFTLNNLFQKKFKKNSHENIRTHFLNNGYRIDKKKKKNIPKERNEYIDYIRNESYFVDDSTSKKKKFNINLNFFLNRLKKKKKKNFNGLNNNFSSLKSFFLDKKNKFDKTFQANTKSKEIIGESTQRNSFIFKNSQSSYETSMIKNINYILENDSNLMSLYDESEKNFLSTLEALSKEIELFNLNLVNNRKKQIQDKLYKDLNFGMNTETHVSKSKKNKILNEIEIPKNLNPQSALKSLHYDIAYTETELHSNNFNFKDLNHHHSKDSKFTKSIFNVNLDKNSTSNNEEEYFLKDLKLIKFKNLPNLVNDTNLKFSITKPNKNNTSLNYNQTLSKKESDNLSGDNSDNNENISQACDSNKILNEDLNNCTDLKFYNSTIRRKKNGFSLFKDIIDLFTPLHNLDNSNTLDHQKYIQTSTITTKNLDNDFILLCNNQNIKLKYIILNLLLSPNLISTLFSDLTNKNKREGSKKLDLNFFINEFDLMEKCLLNLKEIVDS